jgi:hypothetical protein
LHLRYESYSPASREAFSSHNPKPNAYEAPPHAGTLAGFQSHAVTVQRRALQALRRKGTIGDDAFHAIEEELDIIELTADPRVRTLDETEPSSSPKE